MYAVPHVDELVDVIDDGDVRLVMDEVRIRLDRLDDLLGLVARLQLDVDHTAVDTRARGDRHREGLADTCDGLHGDGVAHAHTWAEVSIGDPLGDDSLHQRADDRVTPWVPARGDDGDGAVGTGGLAEVLTQLQDIGVDIEAVDRVDAQWEDLLSGSLYQTRRGTEDSYIDILQLLDAADDAVGTEFVGDIRGVTTHDTRDLKVGCCLESLDGVATDIPVADDSGT